MYDEYPALYGVGELLDRISPVNTGFCICPPTRMDAHKLMREGYYNIYSKVGDLTKMPSGSLCTGNQASALAVAILISALTCNFQNHPGG